MATRKKNPAHCPIHEHPDHSGCVPKLRRVQGQIEGLARMIEERRYCMDILTQFKAASAALKQIEIQVFESHIQHCVNETLTARDPRKIEAKIRELTDFLGSRRTM